MALRTHVNRTTADPSFSRDSPSIRVPAGPDRPARVLADVCVIGRSFGDLHCSDPMEPASLGTPVLIGPAHADFRQPVHDLRSAGALRVVDREQLKRALRELIERPSEREAMAKSARSVADANRGATARHVALLRTMMGLG